MLAEYFGAVTTTFTVDVRGVVIKSSVSKLLPLFSPKPMMNNVPLLSGARIKRTNYSTSLDISSIDVICWNDYSNDKNKLYFDI